MKYRMPRKLKKKYGKCWKAALGLWIMRKGTTTFITAFTNAFNSILNFCKIINDNIELLPNGLQQGNRQVDLQVSTYK